MTRYPEKQINWKLYFDKFDYLSTICGKAISQSVNQSATKTSIKSLFGFRLRSIVCFGFCENVWFGSWNWNRSHHCHAAITVGRVGATVFKSKKSANSVAQAYGFLIYAGYALLEVLVPEGWSVYRMQNCWWLKVFALIKVTEKSNCVRKFLRKFLGSFTVGKWAFTF